MCAQALHGIASTQHIVLGAFRMVVLEVFWSSFGVGSDIPPQMKVRRQMPQKTRPPPNYFRNR